MIKNPFWKAAPVKRVLTDYDLNREQVLRYFEEYFIYYQTSPTLREVARELGLSSNATQRAIKELSEEGKLISLCETKKSRKWILASPDLPPVVRDIKNLAVGKGYQDILEIIEDYY